MYIYICHLEPKWCPLFWSEFGPNLLEGQPATILSESEEFLVEKLMVKDNPSWSSPKIPPQEFNLAFSSSWLIFCLVMFGGPSVDDDLDYKVQVVKNFNSRMYSAVDC